MIVRKRYELPGMDNCLMKLTFLRLEVNVEFKNGNAANGIPASYSTDNKFIQDAIEDDRRFKTGRIRLAQTNVIQNDKAKEAPKKTEAVKEEEAPRRVVRPKSAFIPKEEPKAAPAADNDYEAVKTVKTVNDAIAFFQEKGEVFQSDEELAALKDKYKVTFPNLK